MKRFLKLVIAKLARIPFIGQFVVGALVSYRVYKKCQRFRISISIKLLWTTFWATATNRVRASAQTPLIVRKALTFQQVLKVLQRRIQSEGLGVLLGKEIPLWYPQFTISEEERTLVEVGNLTPGFDFVLREGLNGIYKKVQQLDSSPTKEAFVIVLESIKAFLNKVCKLLDSTSFDSVNGVTAGDIRSWIRRVPWYPPETFEEALFAVWLLHLFCWYDNHPLIGLGRLDYWLWPYLERDLKQGRLTEEQALDSIKRLIMWLNNSRVRKSNVLLGDTGQTLVIGGTDSEGNDSTNPLTFLFLKAVKELKLPEPKLVARVHRTSRPEYISELSELVTLNLGYPLICNDETIIPALEQAGYSQEDARNYVVAACWEYLVPGRSFDRVNIDIVPFLVAVLNGIDTAENRRLETFDDFMQLIENELETVIQDKVRRANSVGFISAPFFSVMYPDCIERGLDITEGGAKYKNYGFLGTGFANAVDSLAAIKTVVYEKKLLTLQQLKGILKQNFRDHEQLLSFLQRRTPKYGNDNDNVDVIAVRLAKTFARQVRQHKTRYGGRFRPGLGSAGGYIYEAKSIGATPDGRRAGEPYAVNLSPSPGRARRGPTAILCSVTKLPLRLMSNCAAVELAINVPTEQHYKSELNQRWIKCLIQGFVNLGGAELQFNLVDAKILREAQQHPELYRDLLVRVWGFSAYFVELPKEFQDHIIARAESCTVD